MSEWGVLLNGVYLSGGDGTQWEDIQEQCLDLDADPEPKGCLSAPPDGLGAPALRTEDVSYPQRDGVKHFSDWYEPRIITLEDVSVCPDGCPACPSAREKVRDISKAWGRQCDDVELVIYTDCHGQGDAGDIQDEIDDLLIGFGEGGFGEGPFGGFGISPPEPPLLDRSLVGPFGVIGRPRQATVSWNGYTKCATMTLRFDAVDHRMYILDECGTPGSGEQCVTLNTDSVTLTRCYDAPGSERCYPRCYTNPVGDGGSVQNTTNTGTLCAPVTITLHGSLTTPFVENLTTGERINYNGVLSASASPVIIDTATGTATQDGQSRTHLLSGDLHMFAQDGLNTFRLGSFNPSDTGTADVCYRPAVVMA